jgi:eukaryotic-like serine/threonine-protein kinase
MTREQWDEVKSCLYRALQCPEDVREAFLIETCSDESVRLEVVRLLRGHEDAKEFLSHGAPPQLSEEDPTQLTPGFRVGRYEIDSSLGSGGMGQVYLAHDTALRRQVAIKLLLDESAENRAVLRRFRSEAQALSSLNHSNICTVHDIGEHDGRTFIVMEYISGSRLDEMIRQRSIRQNQALDYARQMAAGLAAAHAAGIVHRDLKPANIIITGDGRVKILDFGVAKLSVPAAGSNATLTVEGTLVGTPAYMSPEQAEAKDVDARSDIFSFGSVLFEMISGQRAFGGDTYIATLSAVLQAEPPHISRICPGTPPQLDELIARCLCKDPQQRYQSADELGIAVKNIGNQTNTEILPAPPALAPAHRILRLRLAMAAICALVLGLAGWAGLSRYRKSSLQRLQPAEKVIAVVPFNVIGSDEELRALSDGLLETLTSKLSEMEALQGKLTVVPASEIRSRKITSVEAARRIYGAKLAITGSGQRWNGRIQFTLNLVDTNTVRQIASRTFDFDGAKSVTLRDEVVNGAIQLLALKLSPKMQEAIDADETSVPAANTEYMKGAGYLFRYDLAGNPDRAIQSLTEATRLDPKYAKAFAALGEAHWIKANSKSDPREKEVALEAIRKSIRLAPNLPEGHIQLGKIYANTGQIPEAIEEEKDALRLAPENADVFGILGGIYTDTKQYDQAEAAYQEAIRRKPADWLGHLRLGVFYSVRGRNPEARKQYEEALAITPDNEIVFRNLAILDETEGHFKDASDRLEKTLQFEKNVRTYSALGAVYYFQRRYPEALDAIKAGLELNPDHYSAWGNLGSVYRHIPGHEGDASAAFHKAIGQAQKALEVTPSDLHIRANLAEYEAKLGDPKKAIAELHLIPMASRGDLADEFILIYELCGQRSRAIEMIRQLPADDQRLPDLRSDPDLDSLFQDPAMAAQR